MKFSRLSKRSWTVPVDKNEEPSTQRPEVSTHLFGISLITFARKVQKKLASISPKTWAIFLMFGVFFALRLYRLGYHDFWYDEVCTAIYFPNPAYHDWNAPLYLVFLRFWIKIFGISEFSLRFPSLFFNFLSVIITFFLGKELFNNKVGVFASLLIGLSPFHLWYAQEARDYSMVLVLGTASSYFLVKAIKDDKNFIRIFFLLTAAGGLYANYFYMVLFLTQIIILVFLRRSKISFKELLFFLSPAIIFLPWASKFLDKFFNVWQGFWVLKPHSGSLLITFENFILGYNANRLLYDSALLLSGILFFSAARGFLEKSYRKPLLICLSLFCVPVFGIYLFSNLMFSIYLDRALILFSPYAYLLLSVGIVLLSQSLRVFICGIFLFIMAVSTYRFLNDIMVEPVEHHLGTYLKKPVRPIVRYLKEHVHFEDEIVAFTNDSARYGVEYYGKSIPNYYFFDVKILDTTWQKPVADDESNVPTDRIKRLKFNKLWVIFSDWARSGGLCENSKAVKVWLDANFKLDLATVSEGVWICRYSRKPGD